MPWSRFGESEEEDCRGGFDRCGGGDVAGRVLSQVLGLVLILQIVARKVGIGVWYGGSVGGDGRLLVLVLVL